MSPIKIVIFCQLAGLGLLSPAANAQSAETLYDQGVLLFNRGQYGGALPVFQKCYAIVKNDYDRGKRPYKEYDNIAERLANTYHKLGDYDKEEPLALEVMALRAKNVGKEDITYSASLNNLALLYKEKGEFAKSESMNLECLDLRLKLLGVWHALYAASSNNPKTKG